MTQLAERLKAQLGQLPKEERAELAFFLLTTLEPVEDPETVTKEWEAEIARRAADIRSGKAVGKPADQLFAELDKQYK
jgi:putative addiction module component (TIGR02574 family)